MNQSLQSPPANGSKVLCVGDMAADIFAYVMPSLPRPGELLLTKRIAFFPGGNALNTAIALHRLGEKVYLVGTVGDDLLGDLLLSQLAAMGMDVRGVRRASGADTPATLIYRGEGEDRRFIHSLGAADRFTGEDIPLELLPSEGVLLAAGYLKLRSWDDQALIELFRQARLRGCTVLLNICIPVDTGVDPQRCLRLLPHVDVFVNNEDEARVISGEKELSAQARALRKAGARVAIITRGNQGLYAEDGISCVDMGVFSVPLVDPSGCGDCFTAGLIAGLLRSWNLLTTLRFASATGALGATAEGCNAGVPSFDEVEEFAARNEVRYRLTACDVGK
ncbi:MAG: carbohydrate kinase family protein [Acidobacteriota bacterium]